jgi:hypothetical protein
MKSDANIESKQNVFLRLDWTGDNLLPDLERYILGLYRDKSIHGAHPQVWLAAYTHASIHSGIHLAPSGPTSPPHNVLRVSWLPTLSDIQQLSKLQQIGNTF